MVPSPSAPGSTLLLNAAFLLIITCCIAVDAFSISRSRQLLLRPHHNDDVVVSSLFSKNVNQCCPGDSDGTSTSTSSSAASPNQKQAPPPTSSRRDILQQSATSIVAAVGSGVLATPQPANALPPIASFSNPFSPSATKSNGGNYIPGKRCTAYLVDSTIPPSLIPYRAAREAAILKNLGMGSGTPKSPFVEEDINLNNFMNKAVFGTVDAVMQVVGTGESAATTSGKSGDNYQSFVFFGANFDDTYTASPEKLSGSTNADADLAVSLLTDICKPSVRAKSNTAIGLAFAAQNSQDALNEYLSSVNGSRQEEEEKEKRVVEGLVASGADANLANRHLPIFRFAKRKRYPLLALAPNPSDLDTVKRGGLQSLDPARRDDYVADAQGFIALTQDPKFKLYTEKSLLKDFVPPTSSSSAAKDEASVKAEQGNFFAERILVHEACATAIAKWASSRPDSLVVTIAPISDVRFMGGINGRIPRICRYANPDSLVDEDAVTTILLNPNAKETLSESQFLRLEIGTAPNNWAYQTKVADYLWFSSMPKVNMLSRMMNEQ